VLGEGTGPGQSEGAAVTAERETAREKHLFVKPQPKAGAEPGPAGELGSTSRATQRAQGGKGLRGETRNGARVSPTEEDEEEDEDEEEGVQGTGSAVSAAVPQASQTEGEIAQFLPPGVAVEDDADLDFGLRAAFPKGFGRQEEAAAPLEAKHDATRRKDGLKGGLSRSPRERQGQGSSPSISRLLTTQSTARLRPRLPHKQVPQTVRQPAPRHLALGTRIQPTGLRKGTLVGERLTRSVPKNLQWWVPIPDKRGQAVQQQDRMGFEFQGFRAKGASEKGTQEGGQGRSGGTLAANERERYKAGRRGGGSGERVVRVYLLGLGRRWRGHTHRRKMRKTRRRRRRRRQEGRRRRRRTSTACLSATKWCSRGTQR